MIFLPLAIGWSAAWLLLLLDGRKSWVGWIAVGALVAMATAVAALFWPLAAGEVPSVIAGGWPAGIGIRLRADWLSVGFAFPALLLLATVLAIEVLRGCLHAVGPALGVLLGLGLTGLFLTGDVFNFYVFFEISMGAAFGIAAVASTGKRISLAFTFVVMNLFGSVLFLIGVGGLYHASGSLDMQVVAERLAVLPGGEPLVVAALLLAAFLLKLGIFPFHFWVPPVYSRTRAPAAAVLAGPLATIGSYGLLRFGGFLLPDSLEAGRVLLLVIGAATILFGSLMAISKQPVAEVLAYSSIAQNGYILIAVAIGGKGGFAAAYVYAMVNAFAKSLLFLAIGVRGPAVGAAFFVGAMSIAGLPPAMGFVGKVSIFRAAWNGGLVWIVAWIAAGALLAFFYIFDAWQQQFWLPNPAEPTLRPARALLVSLAGLTLLLGIWPELLLGMGARIATLIVAGRQ